MTDPGPMRRFDPAAQPAYEWSGDGRGGPDQTAQLRRLEEQVRQLQRRMTDPETVPEERAIWGSADPAAVIAAGRGDPYEVWKGGLLLSVILRVRVAGSTSTTLQLEVDGVAVTFEETATTTLTLGSGALRVLGTVNGLVLAPGAVLVPNVTAAGTGATGASVHAWIG